MTSTLLLCTSTLAKPILACLRSCKYVNSVVSNISDNPKVQVSPGLLHLGPVGSLRVDQLLVATVEDGSSRLFYLVESDNFAQLN